MSAAGNQDQIVGKVLDTLKNLKEKNGGMPFFALYTPIETTANANHPLKPEVKDIKDTVVKQTEQKTSDIQGFKPIKAADLIQKLKKKNTFSCLILNNENTQGWTEEDFNNVFDAVTKCKSLKLIRLVNLPLTRVHLEKLIATITNYHNLVSVTMSNCNIRDDNGGAELIKALQKNTKLMRLNLNNNPLGINCAKAIRELIEELNINLLLIYLYNNNLDAEGYEQIFDGIIQRAKEVQKCSLSSPNLQHLDRIFIGKRILKSQPQVSPYPSLDQNTIMMLSKKLPCLNMRQVDFGDIDANLLPGIILLAQTIKANLEKNPCLKRFIVDGQNLFFSGANWTRPFHTKITNLIKAGDNNKLKQVLENKGHNLNEKTACNYDAALNAAYYANDEALGILMGYKAYQEENNLDLIEVHENVTPLEFAIENHDHEMTRRLIQQKVNLQGKKNKADDQYNINNSLLIAAMHYNVAAMRLLLDNGATFEKLRDEQGNSLLHVATKQGCVEMVELLLSKGADLEEKCCGKTALKLAQEYGYWELIEILDPECRKQQQKAQEQKEKKEQAQQEQQQKQKEQEQKKKAQQQQPEQQRQKEIKSSSPKEASEQTSASNQNKESKRSAQSQSAEIKLDPASTKNPTTQATKTNAVVIENPVSEPLKTVADHIKQLKDALQQIKQATKAEGNTRKNHFNNAKTYLREIPAIILSSPHFAVEAAKSGDCIKLLQALYTENSGSAWDAFNLLKVENPVLFTFLYPEIAKVLDTNYAHCSPILGWLTSKLSVLPRDDNYLKNIASILLAVRVHIEYRDNLPKKKSLIAISADVHMKCSDIARENIVLDLSPLFSNIFGLNKKLKNKKFKQKIHKEFVGLEKELQGENSKISQIKDREINEHPEEQAKEQQITGINAKSKSNNSQNSSDQLVGDPKESKADSIEEDASTEVADIIDQASTAPSQDNAVVLNADTGSIVDVNLANSTQSQPSNQVNNTQQPAIISNQNSAQNPSPMLPATMSPLNLSPVMQPQAQPFSNQAPQNYRGYYPPMTQSMTMTIQSMPTMSVNNMNMSNMNMGIRNMVRGMPSMPQPYPFVPGAYNQPQAFYPSGNSMPQIGRGINPTISPNFSGQYNHPQQHFMIQNQNPNLNIRMQQPQAAMPAYMSPQGNYPQPINQNPMLLMAALQAQQQKLLLEKQALENERLALELQKEQQRRKQLEEQQQAEQKRAQQLEDQKKEEDQKRALQLEEQKKAEAQKHIQQLEQQKQAEQNKSSSQVPHILVKQGFLNGTLVNEYYLPTMNAFVYQPANIVQPSQQQNNTTSTTAGLLSTLASSTSAQVSATTKAKGSLQNTESQKPLHQSPLGNAFKESGKKSDSKNNHGKNRRNNQGYRNKNQRNQTDNPMQKSNRNHNLKNIRQ